MHFLPIKVTCLHNKTSSHFENRLQRKNTKLQVVLLLLFATHSITDRYSLLLISQDASNTTPTPPLVSKQNTLNEH